MNKNKLIAVKPETKEELNRLKICRDETYNSLIERLLPRWAQVLKAKLNEEENQTNDSLPKTNEQTNTS